MQLVLLCAVAFVSHAIGPCRHFECKDPVDPSNPEVCANLDKKSDTLWIEYVGKCRKNIRKIVQPMVSHAE